MKEQGIVPDLIPIALKQVAGNNYGGIALNMGNELTPAQVKVCIRKTFLLVD